VTAAWAGFRSPLASHIEAFLSFKRALGCLFRVEERALRLLDRFLLERHVASSSEVTPEVVDAFLRSRPRRAPRSYNHLRGTVGRLFDWMVARELIPRSPLRSAPRRVTHVRIPFLFDRVSAERLLDVVRRLPDNSGAPLRGPTYFTIFALLYGLGLRVGEVAALRVGDVDPDRQLLVIRQTKFSKSRLVPFGPRLASVLDAHLARRAEQMGTLTIEMPVFSFHRGRPVSPGTISQTFHHLLPRLGLDIPEGTAPPRVHDLRHSFAVGTLLRWYRSGIDPRVKLLHLSTFLGHVDPVSTAVYLTITRPLLDEASHRFETWAGPAIAEAMS
jgi:site-specific recombinase XerD